MIIWQIRGSWFNQFLHKGCIIYLQLPRETILGPVARTTVSLQTGGFLIRAVPDVPISETGALWLAYVERPPQPFHCWSCILRLSRCGNLILIWPCVFVCHLVGGQGTKYCQERLWDWFNCVGLAWHGACRGRLQAVRVALPASLYTPQIFVSWRRVWERIAFC